MTSTRRRAQGIVHAAAGIALAENQAGGVQFIPAYGVRHGIIRHKQAVEVFVLRCVVLRSLHFRCELIGVHRSGVGKGNIVQGGVRHGNRSKTGSGVYRAGNIFAGEVKPVCPAGGEVELLGRRSICQQHRRGQRTQRGSRRHVAGNVQLVDFLVRQLRLCLVNGFQLGRHFLRVVLRDFLRVGKRIDHGLYALYGHSFRRVALCAAYLADIAAGRSRRGRGIAAVLIMLMLAV